MRTKVLMLIAIASSFAIAIYLLSVNAEETTGVVVEPLDQSPLDQAFVDGEDRSSGSSEINASEDLAPGSLAMGAKASRKSIAGAWSNQLIVSVQADDGLPVEGAAVVLSKSRLSGGATNAEAAHALRGSTDALGQFQVSQLEPGDDYWVKVDHEDYLSISVGPLVVAKDGAQLQSVQLRRNNRVSGYVRDQLSGRAIAGATLTIAPPLRTEMSVSPENSKDTGQTIQSDGQGFYSFEALGDGLQELTCRAENYATQSLRYLRFDAEQPASQTKDFDLALGEVIAGVAVGPAGAPLEGVRVVAYAPKSRGEAVSDHEGRFRIDGLKSNTYILEAHCQRELQQVLDVPAGKQDCVIRFESSGTIAGFVRLPEGEEASLELELVLRKLASVEAVHGIPVAGSRSGPGDRGAFAIDGVPAGRFLIEVKAEGFANTNFGPIEIAQGQHVEGLEIVLSEGAGLHGTLVAADGGRPIAGATIALSENRWEQGKFRQLMGFESGLSLLRLESNSEGEFGAEGLTAGSYRVSIHHPDYFGEILDGVVAIDGERMELGLIELQRGCVITGTVFDSNGEPAAEMGVFLQPANLPNTSPLAFATDGNGRYRIDCAAGAYDLWAAIPPIERIRNDEKPVRINLAVGEELEQNLPLIGW